MKYKTDGIVMVFALNELMTDRVTEWQSEREALLTLIIPTGNYYLRKFQCFRYCPFQYIDWILLLVTRPPPEQQMPFQGQL